MQAVLVLLAVVGSTAWLAVDASKRDWSDNGFAKNVPTWVVGSLLLWIIVFPMYVFVQRKKAPLRGGAEPETAPPAPVVTESAPAVAMAAARPSEQYGPSLDDVAPEEPQPEPALEIEREPVVEVEVAAEPEPEPIVEIEPEPDVEIHHEPVVEIAPEPVVEVEGEPVVEIAPEPVVEIHREPVIEFVEPVVALEPEPVVEQEPEPAAEPEAVLEISHPELPVDEAPPGLAVDAFKDIKPVAFGGFAPDEDESEPVVQREPEAEIEIQSEPVHEPEPTAEIQPEPAYELEPTAEIHAEPVYQPEPELQPEPEPALAAAVAEPAADEPKPKRRGLRLPNPQLKLPSFGKKKQTAVTAQADTPKNPKPKSGLKLPQITLPPNLEGPLNELERKIALGSVVAIVAAAALGYMTAPSDDAAAPAPAPAPAAASR